MGVCLSVYIVDMQSSVTSFVIHSSSSFHCFHCPYYYDTLTGLAPQINVMLFRKMLWSEVTILALLCGGNISCMLHV